MKRFFFSLLLLVSFSAQMQARIIIGLTETKAPYLVEDFIIIDGVTYKFSLGTCELEFTANTPTSITIIGGSFEAVSYNDELATDVVLLASIPRDKAGITSSVLTVKYPEELEDSPFPVTEYSVELFEYKERLTSVVLPEGFTSIPGSIFSSRFFSGCTALTSVTIPNSVTTIGWGAFWGCNSLTSIIIPNSVTSIEDFAFADCGSLTSINIPEGVTSIGDGVLAGCDGLTSIVVESGNTAYDSRNNCNAIIETSSNTLIAGCKESVIPTSVTSIGDYAFWGCNSLTSVTIPDGVTSIGDWAFMDCSSLTSIIIPNSVTSIGESLFEDCSSLSSVTIGNSVTSIGPEAFSGCSSLTSVTIGNSVTSIGEMAFEDCSSLTSVTIPNSVTSIGYRAFYDCRGLTSMTIPNSLTSIENMLFFGCSSLTSVTIPNSVTTIGGWAFYACRSLTTLTIGTNVKSIGKQAFMYCSSLTSVTIPNSVTTIENSAFFDCDGLTSVTIGNSVTGIEGSAFYSCDNLRNYYVYTEQTPETGENVFGGVDLSYKALHVPASALETYKSADQWKEFGNIMALSLASMGEVGIMEIDFSNSGINENTSLDGNIMGGVYYNIRAENGSFKATDNSIVLNKPTSEEQMAAIADKEIFDPTLREQFTGLIFKVPAGSGKVTVTAETTGNMVLKVKIGSNEPVEMAVDEKQAISFPYNVAEESLVYIYAGENSSASVKGLYRAPEEEAGTLKIYGIEWSKDEVDGIDLTPNPGLTPNPSPGGDGSIYNLSGQRLSRPQRGVNIIDGKKVIVK